MRRWFGGFVGLVLVVGLGVVLPVSPVVAVVGSWVGGVDVSVDRAVVDAADGSAVVRVVPSGRVESPFVLSLYNVSTGRRVGYCGGSASA
ncbi:MAG: hypothetical protein LBJ08_07480, partial [Bifidobacteriaceae bacterium]|nr:hypothetical protein [Bifidobacteriaceae bacterium]